jgi:hypothetical protein
VTYRPGYIAVGVCGDLVVGRALVLLLRGSGYDARFLPASNFGEPGALEGVRILLLTPVSELSTARRKALLAFLKDAPGIAEIPILELATTSKGIREGGALDKLEHLVPWPCSTEKLEQRIEATLLANPRADLAAYRDLQPAGTNEDGT